MTQRQKKLSQITGTQGFKAAVLVVLTLIMLIPLSMVRSLINERLYRAYEVKSEISSAAGGELSFAGPVLKVPGTRRIERVITDADGHKSREYYEESFSMWYSPESLDINVVLDTENKFRGIFYTPVFTGSIELKGSFNLADLASDAAENEVLHPGQAEIIIPFFNQKGIRGIAEASWNGNNVTFKPGNRGLKLGNGGIYSEAPLADASLENFGFYFNILAAGAENVRILPLASSSAISIAADWLSPSFSGFSLPAEHNITDAGFSAVWNCSSLSSGLPVKWDDRKTFDEYQLYDAGINAGLINIHDHYEQNERAAKYAVLFILIPFITLFLFEHFFRRRIHVIQYILAGIANIIFYLLLLSMSEHISFNLSYLVSAASVTIMLCLYTFSVLKGDKKAWYMAPVMTAVYLFLFIALQSEDWSLLIGSVGVFAITGFLMFITRKIDFYKSGE